MKSLFFFFKKLLGWREVKQVPLKVKNVKYCTSPRVLNQELDEIGSYVQQIVNRFYSPHNSQNQ